MGKNRIALTLLLAVLLMATVATAQQPDKKEAMKQIEMLRIWRLTDLLKLQPEEASKLFPMLQSYDDKIKAKAREKAKVLRSMQAELKKETPDSASLEKMTGQVLDVERQILDIRGEMMKELKTMLSTEQIAQYLLFEVKFKQELDDLIHQVRREKRKNKIKATE